MKKSILILATLFISVFMFSFSKDKKKIKLPKGLSENYGYVPFGTTRLEKDSVTAGDFYISKTEVTNLDYAAFLADLKLKGKNDLLAIAAIDTLNWKNSLSFNEPYVTYYHSHPAYRNYPVVNVSYEGAKLYCEWITNNINTRVLGESSLQIEARLPSHNEWLRAAAGNLNSSSYSWGGPFIRNSKGMILCNFKSLGSENIHFDQESNTYEIKEDVYPHMGIAGSLNDNADITAPVRSYWPNDYGLYNMNGNVAEMVSEKGIAVGGGWNSPGYDVRNESMMKYERSSTYVGFRPIFTLVKKGG